MGRLFSRSQSFKNVQRSETHSNSTVVKNILRTDNDTVSHTSVLSLRQMDDMAARQPRANTLCIVSKSEKCTVDRVIMRDNISDGRNQLYDASGTKCELNGFHPINPHSLQLFSSMGLHITFRVQSVTPNHKCDKLPCSPTMHTAEMSEVAAYEATRKAAASFGQKNPGYAVIIGSSGYRH